MNYVHYLISYQEYKMNLFKRNEVAVSIINAMREDLERTVNYKWCDMFDRVASDASWRDKKWMKKEMNKLKSEYRLTQIAILRLQGVEEPTQTLTIGHANLGQLNHSTIGTNNPYAQQMAYNQLQMQAQYDRHQAYSFGWSKP